MDNLRYNDIKTFMNGRDISSSFSDPKHDSQYSFAEFKEVWEAEEAIRLEVLRLEEENNIPE